MLDISFGSPTAALLKNMIGKNFEQYSCDPFLAPDAFEIVGLHIGGRAYKMTGSVEVVWHFYDKDDVAVLKCAECQPNEIVSPMKNGTMLDTPVRDSISAIDIINDHETVSHDGEQKELLSTKGVIFHLAGGNELSFELGTWFSELITIRRGYELIKQFTPLDNFLEEWDGCDGYVPSCSREVITLTK